MAEVATLPRWSAALRDPARGVPLHMLGSVMLGALLGIVWALVAERPGYVVGEDRGASIGERALAGIFAADAVYCLLVSLLGLVVGLAAWVLCRHLGWWVCLVGLAGSFVGAVAVWQFGMLAGQENFQERLAAASPGDVVPVDLSLHSLSAILLAPFVTSLVLMLASVMWPERRQPPPAPRDGSSAVVLEN